MIELQAKTIKKSDFGYLGISNVKVDFSRKPIFWYCRCFKSKISFDKKTKSMLREILKIIQNMVKM